MAATITSRLNENAQIFDAGDYKGFGLRLGEQHYNRKTKAKEWTNYKAVIFANNPAQIDFLTQKLVKDSVVSITCKQQRIDVYEGQNGQSITIEMVDASLLNVFSLQASAEQVVAATQQAPQQQAQPQANGFDNFDDDITF